MEHSYDVICIGGGGAGVAAAVAAREAGARVAIVCKEPAGYGNTRMAVGLAACSGLPGDSRQAFIDDILSSGEKLCNPEIVEILVDDAEEAVLRLETFGHTFIRDGEGKLAGKALTRAGGHTFGRTLQSSGGGVGLGQSLRAAVEKYRISLYEDALALSLIKENGTVCGVKILDLTSSDEYTLFAGAVVLCTGGGGWLFYPQTSNCRGATGDGYALAFMAGAELQDMEQIQAIPFALTHPGAYRGLICGEPAVAGPAGTIHSGSGELVLGSGINALNRAQVVRAMAGAISRGDVADHGGLLLDLGANLSLEGGEKIRDRLRATGIFDTVLPAYGKKAYDWQEQWEILPTVHFFMGGIRVDKDGRSTVPGLFAAGEAQGGVHGGNRLGSVALTEIFVFGFRAGRAAAEFARQTNRVSPRDLTAITENLAGRPGITCPAGLIRRLQSMLWSSMGLLRDKPGLLQALSAIDELEELAVKAAVCNERVYNSELRDLLELRFMLTTARLAVTGALLREESRGAHLRADFPEKGGPQWERNIILWQGADGGIRHRMEAGGND